MFLSFSATILLVPAAFAENWPEFRGPTGQGISTARGLPFEWSDTKNVAWKQPIPGKGWSSPVLVDGRLYLTTAVTKEGGASQSLRALCLDAANGKTLWDTEVLDQPITKGHGKNTQASPTPIVEGQRLYVHFGHQGTACLDLAGKVIWKNTSLPYPPVHGNGGSPILVDDALVFSCDGSTNPFIVALKKADGQVLWKTARQTTAARKFSFSTPLVITVNGRKQIISPGSGVVSALDPKNGAELWRVRYEGGYSVIPRPIFGHGLLFIGTGYDRPTVMAIRPDGKGDVTATHVAWTLVEGAPNTPSLLLAGEELYMVSDKGLASCVDARTGKVHWSERAAGGCSASPTFADGRIYIQDEQGLGVVLKPGKTFEKLAENKLSERTFASYCVAEGTLFIRGEQNLYCIKK